VNDGSDDWNVDCFLFQNNNCPSNPGPDYDFASAPNLITYQTPNGAKTILGAGQKSGIYFALDPDSPARTLWQTQVGPGSSLGGMEWGSASDGTRIYVAIANFYGASQRGRQCGPWAALDPATGAILWQKADPNGAIALGPLTVSDGVVYARRWRARHGADHAGAGCIHGADAVELRRRIVGERRCDDRERCRTGASGTRTWASPATTGNNKFYAFTTNGS
jgi:polyvinyl alcohol dehydrogenase (cytochrome)